MTMVRTFLAQMPYNLYNLRFNMAFKNILPLFLELI